jgi:hypothetical protein
MQCLATAATAGTAATGIRAYLAARKPSWLTPERLRLATVLLITVAILAVGIRP